MIIGNISTYYPWQDGNRRRLIRFYLIINPSLLLRQFQCQAVLGGGNIESSVLCLGRREHWEFSSLSLIFPVERHVSEELAVNKIIFWFQAKCENNNGYNSQLCGQKVVVVRSHQPSENDFPARVRSVCLSACVLWSALSLLQTELNWFSRLMIFCHESSYVSFPLWLVVGCLMVLIYGFCYVSPGFILNLK